MKKTLLTLVALLALSATLCAAHITLKELPKPAQTLIHKYFAKDTIKAIHAHHTHRNTTYKVVFTDGSRINFDANGQWTKIKLRNDTIPVEIIPEYITTYVWEEYPNIVVMSIEQEGTAHEVELSDGTELTFDKKGNVIEID